MRLPRHQFAAIQFPFTARRFISASTASTLCTFTNAATLACRTSRVSSLLKNLAGTAFKQYHSPGCEKSRSAEGGCRGTEATTG